MAVQPISRNPSDASLLGLLVLGDGPIVCRWWVWSETQQAVRWRSLVWRGRDFSLICRVGAVGVEPRRRGGCLVRQGRERTGESRAYLRRARSVSGVSGSGSAERYAECGGALF